MNKETVVHAFPDFLHDGMTLRDYFAAKAMQATFGSPIESTAEGKKYIAMHAYKMADAMLEARK